MAIAPDRVIRSVGTPDFPTVFDVRRPDAYDADSSILTARRWRDPAGRHWTGKTLGEASVEKATIRARWR